jgi:serine/threonine-protein kinase
MLPHLGPGGEEALRRFRREAEAAARLEHPGICGVLEAEIDHGTPYIAMRPRRGHARAPARARARTQTAPPDRAAAGARAALREGRARLHAAHEAGIVHRDVKPANLMITPEGEPVVLDFGLAREDDASAPALSMTGEVSGTPAYMSPEQMTGRSRPDRRTDVWSLGIALYEAATLAHPFAAATRESLFQAILGEDAPDPRRVNPEIDRDLATILETATVKERDRRYQTALDLAEDLRRWRENEPLRARPVGRVERLWRWVQRKPALAASLAAAIVLLIAASAFLFYGIGAAGRAETESRLRGVAETAQLQAESARKQAESERVRAEDARAALEQVQADRVLQDALEELGMIMGTLWFGLDAKGAFPRSCRSTSRRSARTASTSSATRSPRRGSRDSPHCARATELGAPSRTRFELLLDPRDLRNRPRPRRASE